MVSESAMESTDQVSNKYKRKITLFQEHTPKILLLCLLADGHYMSEFVKCSKPGLYG